MGNKTSKQPEYWERDGEHPQCQLCDTKFSVVRRRHHCRSCGGVFCAACSGRTASVPLRGFENPVRVCDRCKLREGGVPNLPNAITGTSRSSTGAGVGGGYPQRSRSMDVHGMGTGAASEGAMNYRSATPRAASSLAIIENSSRNRGAVTPRLSALGGAGSTVNAHSGMGGGRPPMAPPQRGQFLNERRSNQNAVSPHSANNNNNANNSGNNNNSKTAPIPSRYRSAVLLLLFSPSSPFFNTKINKKEIGSLLLAFLKQPSYWFDRACIQTHKLSLLGDPYQDWTALTVVSRQPSGLSASVVAKTTTSGISSSPLIAPALFLSAPTLPSTRATTLYLSLKLVPGNNTNSSTKLDLSIVRSLQVGIVHESAMSSRTRALPTPAVSFMVDALSTQRIPAIGVSLEGKSFCGSRVEDSEFFRLEEENNNSNNNGVKAAVVSISFDQSSGSVAFSLMNASNTHNSSSSNQQSNNGSPRSSTNVNFNNNNNGENNSNNHTLPVIAAFPCSLPSGIAGKWFGAFSLDTAQLVDGSQLIAEWL